MGFGILYFLFNTICDKVWALLFKQSMPVAAIKTEEKPDPIIAFVRQRQDRLLRTYDKTIDMNMNIEPIFYNKQKFSECMREENNQLESRWKKNLLYESTPRGNIFMYYDVYKSGFAYYAEQNCIPYQILNAMAMKYVVTFFCRDFFMDESIIKESSKLAESTEPEPTKNTKKPSNQHMAKFKNYKTATTVTDVKKPQVAVIRNKFISLGKPYNLQLIQKTSKIPKLDMSGSVSSKYDAIFSKPKLSYKDFKASIAAASS